MKSSPARECLVFFGVLLLGLTARGAESAGGPAKKPNILLIFADDQSYKTVHSYPGSYPWARSPNIDSLATTGIRFSHAYLGSWCMPSRATMLTGRYPHGIESMRMVGEYPGATYDPDKTPFWPSVFRKNGYQTAHIGKWHTGNDAGFGRDWDYQIVWNRPKHPENAGNYYDKQLMAFNGEERMVEGYSTDNYTRWACDYIRGQHRDANKPWYLWLCYGAIHGPSHPAKRHVGAYKDVEVPVPADIFPPRSDKPAYLNKTQAFNKGPNGEPILLKSGEKFGDESGKKTTTFAQWARQVNECALALDEGVGEVLAALKESGQWENTLVVYTADQGFAMGEHGFRTKLAPYDANYRSPLFVSMPGTLPQGQVCQQSVTGADLVATFFHFAGIELPWKMHGHDLSPLLRDPANAPWPHVAFFEHMGHDFGSDTTKILAEGGTAAYDNVPWWVAIRQGPYKYIRTLVKGETEELYDVETDPEELINLISCPDHQARIPQLREATIAELRRTDAGFVEHLP